MTSHYHPTNGSAYLFDLIDKHVKYTKPVLQIHYEKAAETRALLKSMGCWPKPPLRHYPPKNKKARGKTQSMVARVAYEWALARKMSYTEAAEKFYVSTDAIHSYRQYNKLKPLRK